MNFNIKHYKGTSLADFLENCRTLFLHFRQAGWMINPRERVHTISGFLQSFVTSFTDFSFSYTFLKDDLRDWEYESLVSVPTVTLQKGSIVIEHYMRNTLVVEITLVLNRENHSELQCWYIELKYPVHENIELPFLSSDDKNSSETDEQKEDCPF